MPNLEKLYVDTFHGKVSDKQILEFVCDVLPAVILHNKDVIVSHLDPRPESKYHIKKLKISKKGIFDEKHQTVEFGFVYKDESVVLHGVKAFVQSKLNCYDAILVD